ncbi:bifunctional diguanylate cyclase/phosphodiesterase [Ramlibacter sp. MAHUQ-53]|uniref:bifunctional diguanylate cyclase/phosphodiesterase n=1 Tax=unclassified Ramlibacter TaxID=2617605 RepID=UPI00362CF887
MPLATPHQHRIIQAFTRSSVKARVTILVLVVMLASALATSLYGNRLLEDDLERLLSAQQFEASKILANTIDQQLSERLAALDEIGRLAGQRHADPGDMQALLAGSVTLQQMFNGGLFITDPGGTAVASVPTAVPRVGLDYSDRDYVRAVMATGQRVVSRPTVGKALGVPVLVLAAPVRNIRGEVTGVVAGVIELHRPNFLDAVKASPFGQQGTFLLVAPDHRLVITASDPKRVMDAMPPPGAVPAIDRFAEGFEGSAILTNPQGVRSLSSAKRIPVANWYLVTSMPTEIAFAPARQMQLRLLAASAVLALASGLLVWWVIRRQLEPLQAAAEAIAGLSEDDLATGRVQPLPPGRADEIGQLIERFNMLLMNLRRQNDALEKSELLYSTAFRTIPDAVSLSRLDDGVFLAANDSFARIFGWKASEIIGRSALEISLWRRPGDRIALTRTLQLHGHCDNQEVEFVTRDGRVIVAEMSATRLELEGVECLLGVVHDITARKQAQQQIEVLAFTDAQTGLPNRRLFLDRLEQALPDMRRRGERGALVLVGLEQFGALHARIGTMQADELLQVIGRRLDMGARDSGVVAHLGNGEFAVLAKGLSPGMDIAATEMRRLAAVLLDLAQQPVQVEGRNLHCTATVGIARVGDDDAETAEGLLQQAELALTHGRAGAHAVTLFEPGMQASAVAVAETEAGLRKALADGELELFYQPQVDGTGWIIGAEALLRWRHPVRGLVPPDEFIPVAERGGLITALGQWAVDSACRRLAFWASDPVMAALTIGVNVSPRQFREPAFVDHILARLEATGARPDRLKLELTESVLLDDPGATASRMRTLKSHGVSFSLDDFGTGFSSLAYLQHLPLDELKIDRRFVVGIAGSGGDRAIARTIVALGDSLGLQVLAEGVETEAQQAALAEVGCARFQGYLFGRPLPLDDFEALVRKQFARSAEEAAPEEA